MEFIATHWYIWLAVMIVGYGFALVNQIGRMKRMTNLTAVEDIGGTFFEGVGKLAVAAAVGMGGMVLLAISIIMNIVRASN